VGTTGRRSSRQSATLVALETSRRVHPGCVPADHTGLPGEQPQQPTLEKPVFLLVSAVSRGQPR